MELIEFPEQTIIIAKDQPEYKPLPAHIDPVDPCGVVTCCWKLSWRERLKLFITGKIWHQVCTFKHALQPQLLHVDKPQLIDRAALVAEWREKDGSDRCTKLTQDTADKAQCLRPMGHKGKCLY